MNARCWIITGAMCSILAVQARAEQGDIQSARAEMLRLREERAGLRDSLSASPEIALADIQGYATLEASYRVGSEGSRDMDLFLWFGVEVGDDSRDKVTASASGMVNYDLNGHNVVDGWIPPEQSAYEGYAAIVDEPVVGFLHTAYVDINRLGPIDKLRVGRQFNDGFAGGHFDGAQLMAEPFEDTSLRLYGGVPVNYYSLRGEDPLGTDRVLGGAVTGRWVRDLAVTLEVQGMRDESAFYGKRDDYLAILALDYAFTEDLRASLTNSVISGEQRDLQGMVSYWNMDHIFTIQFDFIWVPNSLFGFTNYHNPYTDMMGALEPYRQFNFMITKGLGEHFELGADFTSRALENGSDESVFNQDYNRFQIALTTLDLPVEDLTFTVHYDYWDATLDDTFTLGGDIRQRLGTRHILEAGTYFSKFKYREYTLVDTVDVRTIFARWRWALAHDLSLHVKGEIEDTDVGTFNTLSTALTWRF